MLGITPQAVHKFLKQSDEEDVNQGYSDFNQG